MFSSEEKEARIWLEKCMKKKIPIRIVSSLNFLDQQKEAINNGALPYAYVRSLVPDDDLPTWCFLRWTNEKGELIYSNNYPRSVLDYYSYDNENSLSHLSSFVDFF